MNLGAYTKSVIVGLLAAFLTLTGCGKSAATAIVVIVDTDMAVPAELDGLTIVASGPTGMMANLAQPLAADSPTAPYVFTIAPVNNDASAVDLTVTGTLAGGTVVTRQVRTTFIKGKTLQLFIFLRALCGTRSCPGQTCGNDGSCASIDMDPTALPEFSGQVPTDLDAGTPECTPTGAEVCDNVDNDCNGMVDDGDLTALCPLDVAMSVSATECVTGTCVNTCDAGFGDCDSDPANGCEVNTTSDNAHCGGCGVVCDSTCITGACPRAGWVAGFGASDSGSEEVRGVVIAEDGSVFVTGTLVGNLGVGGEDFTGSSNRDVFVAKFAADGSFVAAKRYAQAGDDDVVGIVLDSMGNPMIAGSFTSSIDFGDGGELTTAGPATDVDMYVARLAAADLSHLGSRRVGGSAGAERAEVIAVNASGILHVLGHTASAINFSEISSSVNGPFLARFVPNGASFDVQAATSFGADITWQAMAAGGVGKVWIAGAHNGPVEFGGGMILTGSGLFLANFQISGSTLGHQWSTTRVGTGMAWTSLRVDSAGEDLYVGGTFGGNFDLDLGAGNITASAPSNVFVARIGAVTGMSVIWQNSLSGMNSSSNVSETQLALEELSADAAQLVVSGSFVGGTSALGSTIAPIGRQDAFHVGFELDLALDTGPANPRPRTIGSESTETLSAMDARDGRVCITGKFDGTGVNLMASPGGDIPELGPATGLSASGAQDIYLMCYFSASIPPAI